MKGPTPWAPHQYHTGENNRLDYEKFAFSHLNWNGDLCCHGHPSPVHLVFGLASELGVVVVGRGHEGIGVAALSTGSGERHVHLSAIRSGHFLNSKTLSKLDELLKDS